MPLPPIDAALVTRLLDVIERDVLPLTERGVARGNKVFGAALLRKSDLSTVLAETNDETSSPLRHGEVHLLERYHALPEAERPPPPELVFLATHEPCSLCLSAITWSGFDNFVYLFTHEDSRDAFAIPHDLRILEEVFGVGPGGYRRDNAFWESRGIRELIAALAPEARPPLEARVSRIASRYAALSARYQDGKAGNAIPLR